MLDTLPFALIIGTLLGFLSGLGIGGGSLLIIWLTVVLAIDPLAARSINLLFFLPSALVVSFFRWRRGQLRIKPILPAILAGCVAAGIFSLISAAVDVDILKKLFGAVLIAAGLREIFHQTKEKGSSK